MLLFAAALFFAPHYNITHSGDLPVSVVADSLANTYIFTRVYSAGYNRGYLNKVDADGDTVYRVPLDGIFSIIRGKVRRKRPPETL